MNSGFRGSDSCSDIQFSHTRKADEMDLQAALEEYRYAVLDLTPKTRIWYEQKLRRFGEWCQGEYAKSRPGDIPVDAVHATMVRRFLEEYRTTPTHKGKLPSTYTTKGYAQVIKGFFTWCDREGIAPDMVGKRVRLPRVENNVIKIFSPEQLKRLFAACKQEPYSTLQYRARAMLALLLGTGMRANELCTLTMERLFLDTSQPKNSYVRVKGKGRKEREIGLPVSAVEHIARYIRRYRVADECMREVFLGRKRIPITPNGLDQWMERLGDWAGITGVRCSPHTLRHTFSVNFLVQVGDLFVLSRILGHTSVATTQIYLQAMSQQQVRQTSFSVLDYINERR